MKSHLFHMLLIAALVAVSALVADQAYAQQASELFSAVARCLARPAF